MFISLFVLFLLEFYHLLLYPYGLIAGKRISIIFYLLPIFFLSKGKLWKDNFIGKKLLVLYLFFAITNIFTCYYFRGQRVDWSLLYWLPMFYVFYYLTFRSWDKDIIVWEKVIENLFFVLLILYALKNMFLDWEFFKNDAPEERFEYESRVRVYSDAFLELGYLFCLNKFLVSKRLKYLMLAIIGFLFIFLQGFRMMIVMGLFVSTIMVFRIYKLSIKTVLIIAVSSFMSIFVALQFPFVQDKIAEILDRNETENFDNDDYVRVFDITYTYTEFFLNNAEMILGAGKTMVINMNDYGGRERVKYPSEYSKERSYLATRYHYYPVDLGYIGLSWEAGIPFTVVCMILFLYLWKIKVDKQYYYLSCYGLYMIMIGLTNAQGYYEGNLICLAIVYTIIERAHKRLNYENSIIKLTNR